MLGLGADKQIRSVQDTEIDGIFHVYMECGECWREVSRFPEFSKVYFLLNQEKTPQTLVKHISWVPNDYLEILKKIF